MIFDHTLTNILKFYLTNAIGEGMIHYNVQVLFLSPQHKLLAFYKERFKSIGNLFCLSLKSLLMTIFCDSTGQVYFSSKHKGQDLRLRFWRFFAVLSLSSRPILRTIPHYVVLMVTVKKLL